MKVLVVDDSLNEVAPGAEGELLMNGPQMSLGYWKDAEKTAAAFVRPPGRTEIYYRTGDRVRRPVADGPLTHLGRIDHQVKLRGQRIELDEVEARLRAHERVGEAVVELDSGAGALVAYLTPAEPGIFADEAELREYCAAWLFATAVPRVFHQMDAFPVTSGGKVDRPRLSRCRPRTGPARAEATAPAGVRGPADALALVWQTVLGSRPRAGDDFFRLGGDSLLAAEVVNRTLAVLNIDAVHGSALVRALLERPTLAGFAEVVQDLRDTPARGHGTTGPAPVDFTAEAGLGFVPPPVRGPEPNPREPENVLLTGATGFVGAFLLNRLISSTDARVHCPVRARDPFHAHHRVRSTLVRYGLDPRAMEDRTECFPADLAAPRLGLGSEHAKALSDELDLIVHSGAQVNFIYPYSALRAANVDGTREILRIAAPRRVPTHFLSTVAVLAGFGAAGVRHVAEDAPLEHADRLTMGYGESKWVAELLLRNAADQGLPVAVHRPYEITGERGSGVCNTETAICSLFKMIAETGLAPDIALPMDFVPVDHVADTVVHIATSHTATRRTYHLTNPKPASLGDVVDRMRAFGYDITTLPYDQWVTELVRHVMRDPTTPTAPFVSLCVDRVRGADISVKEMYLEGVFPTLGRDNTDAATSGAFDCPPVDTALVDRYLEYFFASGFIRRPHTADRGERS